MERKIVDARGQACPQPVILARRAMKEPGSDTIVVLVDNDTARQNVTRMAEREGYLVTAEPSGEDVRLTLTPSPAGSQALDAREKAASVPIPPTGEPERTAGPLVLLIASEGVGQGDSPELGGILMRSFLHTLVEAQPLPDVALFLNSGGRLVADGLPAVEAACAEAIAHGVHSADVVLNILARQRDPGPPATILTPAALTLRHAPIADCARYDNLRRTI